MRFIFILLLLFISLFAHEDKIEKTQDLNLTQNELNFIKNRTVKVVIGTPWEPFGIKKGVEYKGLSYDFWQILKDKTGLKSIDVKADSFSEVLNSIKNRTADITLSVGETKDRREYALFTNSYATFPISIATSKDVHIISSMEFLKDKKIAVGRNFTAHKMMLEKYPDLNYVEVKDVAEGLKLLSRNRVFAFVDILPVLSHNINKYGYTNIKISGNTGIDFNLSFMIRDDFPELHSISNKIIDTLSPDERQAILNKWIAVLYDEPFDYKLFIEVVIILVIILAIVLYKNRELIKYQNAIHDKNIALEEQKNELVQTNALLNVTQEELNSSLKSFKTLVDSTIEAIILVENKKITYCNESFLEVFEYDNKDEVKDTKVNKYFYEDILAQDFNSKAVEIFGKKRDGGKFPLLAKKVLLKYKGVDKLVISVFDLTELRDREKLILEQSKMASMGEMIGNIAHQWRQPLNTITTVASGLKLHKDLGTFDDELLDDGVEAILKNGNFLSQTIDDFRDYLKDTRDKEEFDLTKLISQSLSLVRPSFKSNFIKDVMQINHPIFINSYFNELNQAIINILNNAKDALIENQLDDRYVFINFFVQNDEVVIEIHDNAGGIDETVLKNIYDPYFTTKHKSQGTGLGLYMTYKIITERLNGSIKAENILYRYDNKDYKGANFTIRLPIS